MPANPAQTASNRADASAAEDYRTSHLQKGEDYHRFFEINAYSALLWRFERSLLDSIVAAMPNDGSIRHLDFASGTGRIVHHLLPHCQESVALDVSESMLRVARRIAPTVRIVCADITADRVLEGEQFDLITAFRFFLNAQQSLRDSVLSQLVRRMTRNSVFVFNNHGNYSSLTHRILRAMRPGRSDLACLRHEDIASMLERHGLRVVRTDHVGLLPATEKRMPLPTGVMMPLEWAALQLPVLRSLSNDVIYTCVLA